MQLSNNITIQGLGHSTLDDLTKYIKNSTTTIDSSKKD